MHWPVHIFHRPFSLKVGFAVALSLAFGVSSSRADLWSTPTGSSGSDGSLSATADFEFSAGQLTVTLTNTLAASSFISPGQALSDISFTLSNSPGTFDATTSSAAGKFGTIAADGTVSSTGTDTASDGNNSKNDQTYTTPTRWYGGASGDGSKFGGFSINGDTVLLETIGGGQPTQMITPSIAAGGSFTNPNSGKSGGLENFNSYVIGSATFTLSLSGITSSTTVTGATFSFGTGPDTNVTGTPGGGPTPPVTGAPAPPSVLLFGFGGLGLAVMLIRSRRRLTLAV